MIVSRQPCIAFALLAALIVVPLGASAKTPSYATHSETISGTIASVQNVNHIFVADDRGYTDDVTLRSGAAVSSGGLRLVPGARVSIVGSAAGPTFLATRIASSGSSYSASTADGAYPVAVPVPVPAYYPAPVYYSAYFRYRPFFYGYYGYRPYYYGGYRPYYYGGYRPYYGGYRPYYGGYRPYYGGYHGYHGFSIGVHVHAR